MPEDIAYNPETDNTNLPPRFDQSRDNKTLPPERKSLSTRIREHRLTRPLIFSIGLHGAIASGVEHAHDIKEKERIEQNINQARKENEYGMIAPDSWGETPQEIQQNLQAVIADEEGKMDHEIVKKIDIGMLIIDQYIADGSITKEHAHELKQMLTDKRDHYQKRKHQTHELEVLHEIVQEHRRYDPDSENLYTFFKTGVGECQTATAGFIAIIQRVYPDMNLKIQNFSGKEAGHTRLIAKLANQWFSLEYPTVKPITLEPGSVLLDTTEIIYMLAGTDVQADMQAGEVEHPVTTHSSDTKKTLDNSIMTNLSAASPVQPIASFSDAVPQAEKEERPVKTFEEAQRELIQKDPEIQQIIETVQNTIKHIPISEQSTDDKDLRKYPLRFEVSSARNAIVAELKKETPDYTKIYNIISEIKNKNFFDNLKKYVLKNPNWEASEREKEIFEDEWMKKQAYYMEVKETILSRIKNESVPYITIFDFDISDSESLSQEQVEDLSKTITDLIRTIPDKKILINFIVNHPIDTYDVDWFTHIPFFYEETNITIRSNDKSLDFLKKMSLKKMRFFDIKAPLRDLSGINSLEYITELTLQDIPSDIDMDSFDPKKIGELRLVNPDPNFSMKKIPQELETTLSLTIQSPQDLYNYKNILAETTSNLILDIDDIMVPPDTTIHAKKIKIYSSGGKEQLDSIVKESPSLTDVELNITRKNSDNYFNTINELCEFSKRYPQVSFDVPNPEYDYEADPKSYLSYTRLIVKNGSFDEK